MSEINANIVVEPITLNVTESSINQTVTVEDNDKLYPTIEISGC